MIVRKLSHNVKFSNNQPSREHWLEEALISIPKGSRILDAGAGELQYKKLCSHLNYISLDFGKYDGKGNDVGLQTNKWDQDNLDIISDIASIPIADSCFDAVMCIEVLEHVPYPIDALREIVRILKPNGQLILTAPFCSLTHFSPFFYQTGYSQYFYKYWLTKMGLEIVDLQPNGNYFEYLAQELHRLPSITRKYTASTLNLFHKFIIFVMLMMLNNFSKRDQGSNELLCFGIQVIARKKAL